jgi:hypothetical protein
MRWMGHVVHIGQLRNACNSLVRSREELRRPFGRLTQRWEDNIKLYLREIW